MLFCASWLQLHSSWKFRCEFSRNKVRTDCDPSCQTTSVDGRGCTAIVFNTRVNANASHIDIQTTPSVERSKRVAVKSWHGKNEVAVEEEELQNRDWMGDYRNKQLVPWQNWSYTATVPGWDTVKLNGKGARWESSQMSVWRSDNR